ncbi:MULTISPECIES: ABC transporter permease [Streptomyces]|jgi:ABC-2 type transport system permease protein|uniref:Transport permease protein n=2 Tax=Streptomyces TaxID=1883 RepID=A0A0N9LY79_9ACTN|nr:MULTISPECIES: ABC transporter permease [Streptomyces]ALG65296.1 Cal40 [Streptomyces calvus]MBA8943020.1 ABC-2 type transport system permease protein [Streptomyces calvus]MBA8978717.1 ABC-2 type transport system permease protein [Streptomyces calvus]MYS28196.1 ABC transporter permease [Streptomyces sp. SID7804]QDI71410.1 ABC transporter permease [Streptomyces calvus]
MTVAEAGTPLRTPPVRRDGTTAQWGTSGLITQTAALTGRSLRPYLNAGVIIVTFVEPLVMLLMFAGVLKVLGEAPGMSKEMAYIDGLAPAIMIITAVAAGAQAGNGLINDLRNEVITRFHTLPINRFSVLLARSFADAARSLYQLIAVAVLAAVIFGFSPPGGILGVLGAILMSLLVGWSMSWIFIMMAALMRNGDVLRMITTLLTFPLLFASNAFVPPESMPTGLRVIAQANPISYANDAVRAMVAGNVTVMELVTTVAVCLALVCVCAPISKRSFRVL